MNAREALERRIAAIIAEHVEIGYSLLPDGLVDPDTIKVTGATGAASVAIAAYEAALGIGEGGENVVVNREVVAAVAALVAPVEITGECFPAWKAGVTLGEALSACGALRRAMLAASVAGLSKGEI